MYLFFAIIMALIALWIWPGGISEIPFSQLTLKLVFGSLYAMGASYCAFLLLAKSFEHDRIWPWRWTWPYFGSLVFKISLTGFILWNGAAVIEKGQLDGVWFLLAVFFIFVVIVGVMSDSKFEDFFDKKRKKTTTLNNAKMKTVTTSEGRVTALDLDPAYVRCQQSPPNERYTMSLQQIYEYIHAHYDEFPNFDGRTAQEVLAELPAGDARYGQGETGMIDLLNEIAYHPAPPKGPSFKPLLSSVSTAYLAYCAGYAMEQPFPFREIPREMAHAEIERRRALGDEGAATDLAVLKSAPDYKVLSSSEERYYAGPDGPFRRTLCQECWAFGATWYRRQHWIDRARDVRTVWFMRTPQPDRAPSVQQKLHITTDELDSLFTSRLVNGQRGKVVAARLRQQFRLSADEALGAGLMLRGVVTSDEGQWLDDGIEQCAFILAGQTSSSPPMSDREQSVLHAHHIHE